TLANVITSSTPPASPEITLISPIMQAHATRTVRRYAEAVDSWRFPHRSGKRCGKRHESTELVKAMQRRGWVTSTRRMPARRGEKDKGVAKIAFGSIR
ncbi:MAG TPA: hypothetical protein VNW94_22180, partial [Streptosporangiaceae bacterium]|nr:hypothetical protein [Streptosporangiaceae bacterium]